MLQINLTSVYAESRCLTWLMLAVQIKRLCLSLQEQAPEGAALEAFLAHPDHVLARVSRDISQPDVAIASLEKPMQVTSTLPLPQCTRPVAHWHAVITFVASAIACSGDSAAARHAGRVPGPVIITSRCCPAGHRVA